MYDIEKNAHFEYTITDITVYDASMHLSHDTNFTILNGTSDYIKRAVLDFRFQI